MLGQIPNAAPATGAYIAYPSYYALQLASKIAAAGGQVVSATSSYSDLKVYAVKEANGDLGLLVINTNPAAAMTDQFNMTGFQPGGPAQVWQYGKAQDTAQSLTTNGASSLANSSTTLNLNGSSFSYSFPAYSMTVLDVKAAPVLTSITVSLVSSNLATTGTEQFSATAPRSVRQSARDSAGVHLVGGWRRSNRRHRVVHSGLCVRYRDDSGDQRCGERNDEPHIARTGQLERFDRQLMEHERQLAKSGVGGQRGIARLTRHCWRHSPLPVGHRYYRQLERRQSDARRNRFQQWHDKLHDRARLRRHRCN